MRAGRFRWLPTAAIALLVIQIPTVSADPGSPARAETATLVASERPDLVRCGGWEDEDCRTALDAYGRRVAANVAAVRAVPNLLPDSATATAVVDECTPDAFPGAVCGHVDVPLNRSSPSAGTISIAFELYTHADPGPATSAILVNFGGPGAGTIPSRGGAFFLFGPNLATHDLLLIDDRGRGYSNLIDCPAHQYAVGSLEEQISECASILGNTVSRYGSGDVAMDTDAVRESLGYELVDYYGVSYGGADIGAYATRFPEHIRSLVLDSPWGATAILEEIVDINQFLSSSQDNIRIVCRRSPSCRAERTDPVGDFAALVEHVRSEPVTGRGTSSDGARIDVTVDTRFVLDYLMLPYGLFTNNAEIAAAAMALGEGDRIPLLRLAAEGYYPLCCQDPPDPPPPPPVEFSAGAYLATYCADNHWEWDWSATVAQRVAQHDAALAAADPALFLPFTGIEGGQSSFVSSPQCLLWPNPTGSSPIAPPGAVYPDVPTLVIGGDLDNVVPLQQAEWVADLFPNSHLVAFAGAGHGAAFWHSCATALAQEFVETLELGDTSCAGTPEFKIPAVGEFPLVAADATPAEATSGGGNRAIAAERRVAAVATAGVKDALTRAQLAFFGPGELRSRGLRGGRVLFDFNGAHGSNWVIHLRNVRFAEDVILNGVIRWPAGSAVHAELQVSGPGTAGGRLTIETTNYLGAKYFDITGELGGRTVAVRVAQA